MRPLLALACILFSLNAVSDERILHLLPNSMSFRLYGHKSLTTEGTPEVDGDGSVKRTFSPLGFWSIGKNFKNNSPWEFKFRITPSMNFYRWEDPGSLYFVHLLIGPKLLYHLDERIGTLHIALGAGPLYAKGTYYSAEEQSLTISPRFQLSFYRYVYDNYYIQFKYNKHYFLSNLFEGDGYYLKSISSAGFYVGYSFEGLSD